MYNGTVCNMARNSRFSHQRAFLSHRLVGHEIQGYRSNDQRSPFIQPTQQPPSKSLRNPLLHQNLFFNLHHCSLHQIKFGLSLIYQISSKHRPGQMVATPMRARVWLDSLSRSLGHSEWGGALDPHAFLICAPGLQVAHGSGCTRGGARGPVHGRGHVERRWSFLGLKCALGWFLSFR